MEDKSHKVTLFNCNGNNQCFLFPQKGCLKQCAAASVELKAVPLCFTASLWIRKATAKKIMAFLSLHLLSWRCGMSIFRVWIWEHQDAQRLPQQINTPRILINNLGHSRTITKSIAFSMVIICFSKSDLIWIEISPPYQDVKDRCKESCYWTQTAGNMPMNAIGMDVSRH